MFDRSCCGQQGQQLFPGSWEELPPACGSSMVAFLRSVSLSLLPLVREVEEAVFDSGTVNILTFFLPERKDTKTHDTHRRAQPHQTWLTPLQAARPP